jgi:OFA family oxalate/formate antiporter-like MFS transporter
MDIKSKRRIFVLCCLSIFFVGSFVFGIPGVMASYWQNTFDVGKEDVGRIMFFILVGTGCSMYLTSKLQEKIRHCYLIFLGNFASAIAMFCVGFANSIAMVYVWALVVGFFCGFVYIPVLTVVQGLYPNKKGTSTGMVNLVFGGAAALVAPLFTMLLLSFGTFVMTSVAAFLCLFISGVASLFIRLPRIEQIKENKPVEFENKARLLSFRDTLRLKPFWLLWSIWALAGAGGISMITLSASYGNYLGLSLDKYVWILISFSIANGAGRLICGKLADHFAQQKILMICFLLSGTAYLLLIISTRLIIVSILASFVGLAFGAMFAVSAPLVSNCFGLINFGRIFGLVFTAYGFIAGCLGPWLSGYILDFNKDNFSFVFIYLAAFYFISSFFIMKIKPVDFRAENH